MTRKPTMIDKWGLRQPASPGRRMVMAARVDPENKAMADIAARVTGLEQRIEALEDEVVALKAPPKAKKADPPKSD